MYSGEKVYGIILAGGSAERFGGPLPKQFLKLAGKMVIEHTIDIFEKHPLIDEIYIVVNPNYVYLVEDLLKRSNYKKVSKILRGGKTRQESTKIGVFAIPEKDGFVLIHDAVRPFVSHQIIDQVIEKLSSYEAVDVAISSSDTIIRKNDNNEIVEIPDRDELMLGQTPQGFHISVLKKAYRLFEQEPVKATDDCKLVLAYSLGKIGIVSGERFNIKITYPEDMYFADKIFQVRSKNESDLSGDIGKLRDKIIVVFGASRGIGYEILKMAENFGARVYGFSRKNNVDISKPDEVREALEKVYHIEGKINYIVNTAAILKMGTLEVRDYDSIISEIMVNYFGSISIIKESLNFLKKSKGMLLLFTSSSYTRGRSLYSVYSSSKAAIVNLVQSIAEEWKIYDCKINAINPSRTNTEMRRENFGYENPSTLLSPKKVAEISLKTLLSNMTGQVIDVRREDF
ncbi:2-C-methyl-D-erythritol 4-phosphate cytidylyltransferase [Thermosipho globiformans]|uniref:2-C-methyl-D-erythritol 4-phosphate cytidylyltransferase n=1 Tax=Thermosipho globiformans TaxID=380685 RepID=UPI000F8CAB2D|nr:2-C-methyl-D-erythritol 4-phosphate cytidylyltransferase [Thermosipho globiformans]